MLLFIQIVHLRFSDLPKFISFQELHSLSRFCDKYKVQHLVLPFVPRWIAPFIRENLDPGQPEWLFISAVWEIDYILSSWLSYLCWNTGRDGNGHLIYAGQKVAELLPDSCRDGIVEAVEEKRMSALSELVFTCQEALKRGCCVEEDYSEQCDMLMTGYLLTGLKKLDNWPLDPKTATISPEELRMRFLCFDYQPLPVPRGDKGDHSSCGLHKLKCDIAAIHASMGSPFWKSSSIGSAFLQYLPSWRRFGLHGRDYEDIDSDSEDDARYREPFFEDTEPDEEFQSDTDPEDREDSDDSYLDSDSSCDDSD